MTREDVINLLKEELSLEVVSTDNYVGSSGDGGYLYEKSFKIRLILGDEIISEGFLD